jgi:hypothetical protein
MAYDIPRVPWCSITLSKRKIKPIRIGRKARNLRIGSEDVFSWSWNSFWRGSMKTTFIGQALVQQWSQTMAWKWASLLGGYSGRATRRKFCADLAWVWPYWRLVLNSMSTLKDLFSKVLIVNEHIWLPFCDCCDTSGRRVFCGFHSLLSFLVGCICAVSVFSIGYHDLRCYCGCPAVVRRVVLNPMKASWLNCAVSLVSRIDTVIPVAQRCGFGLGSFYCTRKTKTPSHL